jgi:hypothetical protein
VGPHVNAAQLTAMNRDLNRSTFLGALDADTGAPARKSLSRFALERLTACGVPASVESLRSPTRTFLLVTLTAEVAQSTMVLNDHGNALGDWLGREVRKTFQGDETLAGIYWRVTPPAASSAMLEPIFRKARADLEAKIRARRAQRFTQSQTGNDAG